MSKEQVAVIAEFNQGAYDAFLSSIADLSDGAYIQACMDYLMNEQGLSEEEAEEVLYGDEYD